MTKPKIKTDNDERKKMLEELRQKRLGNFKNKPKPVMAKFQLGFKSRGRG